MKRKEIRIAGFGGQGVILAGLTLGRAAALYDNKYAVVSQSFGPEARGGACAAEVVITEEPVDFPRVTDPSALVVMSQEAFELYARGRPRPRDLLIDKDLVEVPAGLAPPPTAIPFTATAESLGKKIVTNMVMLGALGGKTGVVSPESLKRAVSDVVPPKALELNLQAFDRGFALGRAAKGGSK
jgi:2-oxoglutarate ferredoxin oxidoreductase subunit gamma